MKERTGIQKHRRTKTWFLIAYSLYFFAVIFYHLYNFSKWQGQSVFDIPYNLGPLIKNIITNNTYAECGIYGMSKDFCFTAHRMPFIPYFLSAIAYFNQDYLFVKLIKNLIFVSLFWLSIYYIWIYAKNVRPPILLLILGFTLSFPSLNSDLWALHLEGAYLIPFISLLFVNILLAEKVKNGQLLKVQNQPKFLVLAIINSLVFLTKSGMAPLSITFCLLYYWATRNFKVFTIFACSLLVASLGWGLFNLHNSGVFTTSSSLDGLNLYKGNNELTSTLYPLGNLDILDQKRLILPEVNLSDEWAYDRYYRSKAIEFIKSHPLETLKLSSAKFYNAFISINRTPTGGRLSLSNFLSLATLYRLIFRIMFAVCLFYAVKYTLSKKGKALLEAEERAVISAAYICFVFVFSAPFLVGFAYERHITPLIVPTIFYLIWMLDMRGRSLASQSKN
jgi:hypothetical protein